MVTNLTLFSVSKLQGARVKGAVSKRKEGCCNGCSLLVEFVCRLGEEMGRFMTREVRMALYHSWDSTYRREFVEPIYNEFGCNSVSDKTRSV